MKTCTKCGTQNPGVAKYCTNCGHVFREMKSCPRCGNMVVSGNNYCMYCGEKLNPEAPDHVSSKGIGQRKSSSGCAGKVIAFLMVVVLIAGGVEGYLLYQQYKSDKYTSEKEIRQAYVEDSLEHVEYERQQNLEKLRIAEEHRLEELNVYITNLYSMRGKYCDKILKYYSDDLRGAYKKWTRDDLDGPQALLFDAKWDNGCVPWVTIRNFKIKIGECSSPTDSIATVNVTVKFTPYDASNDSYMGKAVYEDRFQLKYERGEWRIDDFVRNGKSAKQRYLENSTDYGRERC